jgi:hypothetical protein
MPASRTISHAAAIKAKQKGSVFSLTREIITMTPALY